MSDNNNVFKYIYENLCEDTSDKRYYFWLSAAFAGPWNILRVFTQGLSWAFFPLEPYEKKTKALFEGGCGFQTSSYLPPIVDSYFDVDAFVLAQAVQSFISQSLQTGIIYPKIFWILIKGGMLFERFIIGINNEFLSTIIFIGVFIFFFSIFLILGSSASSLRFIQYVVYTEISSISLAVIGFATYKKTLNISVLMFSLIILVIAAIELSIFLAFVFKISTETKIANYTTSFLPFLTRLVIKDPVQFWWVQMIKKWCDELLAQQQLPYMYAGMFCTFLGVLLFYTQKWWMFETQLRMLTERTLPTEQHIHLEIENLLRSAISSRSGFFDIIGHEDLVTPELLFYEPGCRWEYPSWYNFHRERWFTYMANLNSWYERMRTVDS